MFRFFRTIRQKLLKGGQFSKYLLYAAGEIILVIIGILIALQINNWNEERKAQDLGQEMVAEIKFGLQSDLEEFDRYMYFQQTVMGSQSIILAWLDSDQPFHDSLAAHLSRMYMTTDYTVNYAGYETLKQFGLQRIDSDSLRTSIADLYELQYPQFIKFTSIYQRFLEELFSNNSLHFNEMDYMLPVMRPRQTDVLKADTKYAYDLRTQRNFNRLLLYQGGQLRERMAQTYEMLSKGD